MQAGGQRFDPVQLHQVFLDRSHRETYSKLSVPLWTLCLGCELKRALVVRSDAVRCLVTIFDNCIDWVNITTRLSSIGLPVVSGGWADHATRVSLDIEILEYQAK